MKDNTMKNAYKSLVLAVVLGSVSGATFAQVSNPRGVRPNITVLASSYDKANSQNVALGGPSSSYGADVLLNAPPYQDVPDRAYFRFIVPKGKGGAYQLEAEYAAMVSRPVYINVNGQAMPNKLAATTGCWQPSCQKMLPQGTVTLKEGINSMTVYRSSVFPHIRKFVFRAQQGPNPN
jgi:hypothetical protein